MPSDFKQPPKGPEIGPMKDFDKLPPDKKAELGDLKALAQGGTPLPETAAPAPEQPKKTPDEVADELAALQRVIDAEEPAPNPVEEDAVPTDEDKRAFLRATLANRPYMKTYELFDGSIKMELADLAPREEERLFATLNRTAGINTQAEWEVAHDRMRLAFHTNKLIWRGSENGTTVFDIPQDEANVSALVSILIDSSFKSSATYRAAMYTTRVFQAHLELLLEGVLRPDFWVAGGQDSQSEPTSPA